MSPVEQTNRLAVVSVVMGIVGIIGALTLASLGAVIGSLAVVLGVVARRSDDGRGTATTGIVLGVVAAVLGIASVLYVVYVAPPAR